MLFSGAHFRRLKVCTHALFHSFNVSSPISLASKAHSCYKRFALHLFIIIDTHVYSSVTRTAINALSASLVITFCLFTFLVKMFYLLGSDNVLTSTYNWGQLDSLGIMCVLALTVWSWVRIQCFIQCKYILLRVSTWGSL